MTEFIESPIIQINNWTKGNGADRRIAEDPVTYYYEGKMDIPIGNACRLEVKDGTGENSKKKEILSCNPLVENREGGGVAPPPFPKQGPKMITLPMQDFQAMMAQKLSLSECKVRSIKAATEIYAAMSKVEKDPKAAAQEVVVIARMLEGYFL